MCVFAWFLRICDLNCRGNDIACTYINTLSHDVESISCACGYASFSKKAFLIIILIGVEIESEFLSLFGRYKGVLVHKNYIESLISSNFLVTYMIMFDFLVKRPTMVFNLIRKYNMEDYF